MELYRPVAAPDFRVGAVNRGIRAALVATLALLLTGVWLLRPPDRLEAYFSTEDCRKLALNDATTGRAIVGIEDLALAEGGRRLLLSAHDRLDERLPDGGLYRMDIFQAMGVEALALRSLVDRDARTKPFRPHGISLSPDGRTLAVINRPDSVNAEIEIGTLNADGWVVDTRLIGNSLCRANDVHIGRGDAVHVTFDRIDCGPSWRDLLPGATTGRVAAVDQTGVTDLRVGLSFANGLNEEFVAETRASRLSRIDGTAISLPGGPDNISVTENGSVVVALHPTLPQLWLYIQGWLDRAPTRIVRVEPVNGDVEVLFDDPAGVMFAGATSAIMTEGRMIAGSVRDAGLLICEKAVQ